MKANNKKIIFLIILGLFVSLSVFMTERVLRKSISEFRAEQLSERDKIKGNLWHEEHNIKKPLMDLSEAETRRIIETFGIEIPEGENDIAVRLFADVENSVGKMYYIELDSIGNRDALYKANQEAKNKGLYSGVNCLTTDKNGEYMYYFAFYVRYECNYFYNPPDEGYVKSISELYGELKSTR